MCLNDQVMCKASSTGPNPTAHIRRPALKKGKNKWKYRVEKV